MLYREVENKLKSHDSQLEQVENIPNLLVSKFIKKMQNGESVIIDCKGDSTYYGQTTGNTQVPKPVNVTLQDMLRKYFNNNNITVNNQGIGGHSTASVINNWDNYLNTTQANIIIINYCLNDAFGGTTVEQYQNNLITMIKKTREKGKEIIFDLPNQNINVKALNPNANQTSIENTKTYANMMKYTALQYNVAVIDNYKSVENNGDLNNRFNDILVDGVHGTQEFYNYKARQMLKIFCLNESSSIREFIPSWSNQFKFYGNEQGGVIDYFGGYSNNANKICIVFETNNICNVDISVLCNNTGYAGTTTLTCELDGVSTSYNTLFSQMTTISQAIRQLCIGENIKKGIHFLYIEAPTDKIINLLYLKTYNKEKSISINKIVNASARVFYPEICIPIDNKNKIIEFETIIRSGMMIEFLGRKFTLTSESFNYMCGSISLLISSANKYILSATHEENYNNATKVEGDISSYINKKVFVQIKLNKSLNKMEVYFDGNKINEVNVVDNRLLSGYLSFYNVLTSSVEFNISNLRIMDLN